MVVTVWDKGYGLIEPAHIARKLIGPDMEDSPERNWYAEDAATFGDRLAAARDARGMTQKVMARRMGVALKTLEGWENDMREPRANKLQMVSGLLDVSLSWLLTGEGQGVDPDPAADTPEVGDILNEMRQLRTEMQRSVERMGLLEKRLKLALSSTS